MTIGAAGRIGRQALATNSGIGEGSVRTILKKLRDAKLVRADTVGCHLTESGGHTYRSILAKLTPPLSIPDSTLTVGKKQAAVLVRGSRDAVSAGIEQRDSAIKMGADGATSYVIVGGRFAIPQGSSDCEKDFPSPAWSRLREGLAPRNGDAIIVCGGRDQTTAKLGAISAALTLL
jgi:hypothetical protein